MVQQTLPKLRVAIIGSGVGGLALAIKLKQQLGYDNFTIFEKAEDVGGTWRDNIYPGCSSDVFMAFYSLSTELRDWPRSHGTSADIRNYWQQLARKHNIYPHIQFNTKVTSAVWDNLEKIYHITLEDVNKDEKRTHKAEILVSAIGVLAVPRYPNIPGIGNFRGETWHSARWNPKNVDMRNKKVAVIGNGPSATQFMSCITQDPSTQVIAFCRSPQWILPPIRTEFSPLRRWFNRNIPFVPRIERLLAYMINEFLYLMIFKSSMMRAITTKIATSYIKSTAPKQYQEKLIPNYRKFPGHQLDVKVNTFGSLAIGCKRVIFDTDFCNALHRPNFDLSWDNAKQIVENGIITTKGEIFTFDMIIFATGFRADEFPLQVRGVEKTLQEYFTEKEGPQAYRGTTFPGFPNFFTILGPNTATGHTSVIFTNECQADYIIQLIRPILERQVMTVEVKSEPTDAYNEKIQALLSKSVFENCQSWYRVSATGKISNIFPGTTISFWLWLRRPKWQDYTGIGLEEWLNRKKMAERSLLPWIVLSIVLTAVGVAYFLV